MAPITANPIDAAINTHGNGDHWFGNELLPAAVPIYASRAPRDRGHARRAPAAVHVLFNELDLARGVRRVRRARIAPVRLRGVTVRLPTETFDDRLRR